MAQAEAEFARGARLPRDAEKRLFFENRLTLAKARGIMPASLRLFASRACVCRRDEKHGRWLGRLKSMERRMRLAPAGGSDATRSRVVRRASCVVRRASCVVRRASCVVRRASCVVRRAII